MARNRRTGEDFARLHARRLQHGTIQGRTSIPSHPLQAIPPPAIGQSILSLPSARLLACVRCRTRIQHLASRVPLRRCLKQHHVRPPSKHLGKGAMSEFGTERRVLCAALRRVDVVSPRRQLHPGGRLSVPSQKHLAELHACIATAIHACTSIRSPPTTPGTQLPAPGPQPTT
jgi:hypothetical protein